MTSEQLRAATSNSRLCYVKAGPGSGKTLLASEAYGRLRYRHHQLSRRGVLGITFARSARRELEHRIRLRWGDRAIESPNAICTFDQFHRRIVQSLITKGLVKWPGPSPPMHFLDAWPSEYGATPRPGRKSRCMLTLDDDGIVAISRTTDKTLAPSPAFVDATAFREALAKGVCTHADVRNILRQACDRSRHPRLVDAILEYMYQTICHLVVDEAFDMNLLDLAMLRLAIEADVPVMIVGDPWQSLYEFRGSSPANVRTLIEDYQFTEFEIAGSHRYESDEMRQLSNSLFHGDPFVLHGAREGEEFDVALAHDWMTLWSEQRHLILPAGVPSNIDGGSMAHAFTILLNKIVEARFGIEVSRASVSMRAISPSKLDSQLGEPLKLMRDSDASEEQIWNALRHSFQPKSSRKWSEPRKIAKDCLRSLMRIVRQGGDPILGLSIHQAKGLEWARVLFLDGELTTATGYANVLDVNEHSHRSVYVGLTRAKKSVRVLNVYRAASHAQRAKIEHIHF
ncbi:ATP-dependent helicase [Candidatus Poriferisodalis sp.]|uniref:ATP-dependent helicase n=1 Tax=Candidatus Poriferisodalis sp. TaxID=3101277 RepID=UPI003B0252B2